MSVFLFFLKGDRFNTMRLETLASFGVGERAKVKRSKRKKQNTRKKTNKTKQKKIGGGGGGGMLYKRTVKGETARCSIDFVL